MGNKGKRFECCKLTASIDESHKLSSVKHDERLVVCPCTSQSSSVQQCPGLLGSENSVGTSFGIPERPEVDGGGETVEKRGQWRGMKSGGMKKKLMSESREQLRFIELIKVLKRIPSSRTGNRGDVVNRCEARQGFAAPTVRTGREFRQASTSRTRKAHTKIVGSKVMFDC